MLGLTGGGGAEQPAITQTKDERDVPDAWLPSQDAHGLCSIGRVGARECPFEGSLCLLGRGAFQQGQQQSNRAP